MSFLRYFFFLGTVKGIKYSSRWHYNVDKVSLKRAKEEEKRKRMRTYSLICMNSETFPFPATRRRIDFSVGTA